MPIGLRIPNIAERRLLPVAAMCETMFPLRSPASSSRLMPNGCTTVNYAADCPGMGNSYAICNSYFESWHSWTIAKSHRSNCGRPGHRTPKCRCGRVTQQLDPLLAVRAARQAECRLRFRQSELRTDLRVDQLQSGGRQADGLCSQFFRES